VPIPSTCIRQNVRVDEDERLAKLSEEFGVTRERIREIESRARRRGGGGADSAGVREPRRPLPTAGAGEVLMELDPSD